MQADLTDEAAVATAFARIAEALGPVDILVNVAGGAVTAIEKSAPSMMSSRHIGIIFDVNYRTAVLCAQAVIPGMRARGSGVIINMSSGSAALVSAGGRLSHYGAAKAAVAHLTRDLAAELGPDGIRVNAVAPGLIATARIEALGVAQMMADSSEATSIPLGRMGRPEDVAAAVEFLASDAASYVTGQILSVCGGSVLVPT